LIDEGNVILDNWALDAAGKQMAGQLLALYDCPPWRETYLKHKEKEAKAIQEVPESRNNPSFAQPLRQAVTNAILGAPAFYNRIVSQ
jgi:hypothetical protein